ncbi:ArsR/SmtB family transcription factor [Chloroflexota bacterium]
MENKYNIELYKMKADLCKTLADPRRLIIIRELGSEEKSVGELARVLDIQQSVVSRHLALLREKGVVTSRREGASHYYTLSNPKIAQACSLVHEILLDQIEKKREFAEKIIH